MNALQNRNKSAFALQNLETSFNPRPRCPVALVLDTSYSMYGAPIAEMKEGMQQFIRDILDDECARYSVEMTVITFGGEVRKVMPFTSFADKVECEAPHLMASGNTPMGKALRLGLSEVEARKAFFKRTGVPYYQPWIVLMTDGAPNDNWIAAVDRVRREGEAKKLSILGVGIGPEADMNMLSRLCPPGQEPVRLRGLRFKALFRWLSATIRDNTRSSTDAEPVRPPYGGDFSFNND